MYTLHKETACIVSYINQLSSIDNNSLVILALVAYPFVILMSAVICVSLSVIYEVLTEKLVYKVCMPDGVKNLH